MKIYLRSRGYTLSECRDLINKKFEEDDIDIFINNKQLKKYLINKYGDRDCFAYSRKKVESQMFFSSELKSTDIANTIRNTDVTVKCAKLLREECKTFDVGLDNSYCDGDDVSII